MTGPDLPALPASMFDEPPQLLLDWSRQTLADAGYRVPAAEPELRRRAWSTVARFATDRGPVWAKGNARAFGTEAALLDLLDRYTPDRVVPVIGVDPVHCRMVTIDGGRTLAQAGATEADWTALLTGYADLQTTMGRHLPELRAIGLPDMTPPRLPGWYRAVLDRVHTEPALASLLTDDQRAGLEALMPTTTALAAELAADGLPMTVEHNDLHGGNVFAAGTQGARIFDWGDAAIAHPFHGLGRTVATATGDDLSGDPTAGRLREAYLTAWSGGGPIPPGWRRSAAVAAVLSQVTTAASWLRMSLTAKPERARAFVGLLTDYARRIPGVVGG